jgi:hypothetical protein
VLSALGDDGAWRGRQLRSDVHPGLPSFSVVLAYELPTGDTEVRSLVFRLRGSTVVALWVYALMPIRPV